MRIIKNLFHMNSVVVTVYFAADMTKLYWEVSPFGCLVLLSAVGLGILELIEGISWRRPT